MRTVHVPNGKVSVCTSTRSYARRVGVKTPLELDILQKLYYLCKRD